MTSLELCSFRWLPVMWRTDQKISPITFTSRVRSGPETSCRPKSPPWARLRPHILLLAGSVLQTKDDRAIDLEIEGSSAGTSSVICEITWILLWGANTIKAPKWKITSALSCNQSGRQGLYYAPRATRRPGVEKAAKQKKKHRENLKVHTKTHKESGRRRRRWNTSVDTWSGW